jgi:hypothetical protein
MHHAKACHAIWLVALLGSAAPPPAWAVDDQVSQQTPPARPSLPPEADDDTVSNPAEPDFTIVSLPTSLRLPQFKSAFRVTHRFARPLRGDFGALAADLFGLDSGAQIGLEYRFGIVRNGRPSRSRRSSVRARRATGLA